MNCIQLARNFSLIASTAATHFADNPVLLMVLASQKLPGKFVSKLGAVSRALPQRAYITSLLSLLAGDHAALQAQLQVTRQGSRRGSNPRPRVALANVAIAAGYPELASELLSGATTTKRGAAPAIARLRWHSGDMSGAVDALEGIPSRQARHMLARLESEREVFHGWRPKLARAESYNPVGKTVLHVLTNSLPHTGSGYAQRTHSILKAQRQLGWDVHAVTRPGYPVQLGSLAARSADRLDGVVYHRILPAKLPEGMTARLQLQAEETLRLALRLRPKVLHTTTHFVNAVVTAAVAEALGIPWVYEVRGQLADTWASSRGVDARVSERYRAFVAREAEATQSADLCATLGTAMKNAIAAQVSNESEVVLLPNAVGDAFLNEPLPSCQARQQLGLPAEGTFVGTVSSLVGYEGLDDLIAAFVYLAKADSELQCLIVGAGAAENSLRQQAKNSGVGHRIVFTGRVDRNRAHLYHQAIDIFVLPRKDCDVTRAVTPLKPVEALASARPVVFSDLPALRETIMDGVEGIAFKAGDREALALAITSLSGSPRIQRQMGNAGRNRILAERTWPITALRTTAMYERLKVS